MTSGAEAYFQAAGQQRKPEPAPEPKPARPELRQCPNCGGRIKVVDGQLEAHRIHRMTKTGIREGAKRCDGSGLHIPTATPTTKEN